MPVAATGPVFDIWVQMAPGVVVEGEHHVDETAAVASAELIQLTDHLVTQTEHLNCVGVEQRFPMIFCV